MIDQIKATEDEIKKELDFEWDGRIFDFLGDEIGIFAGERMVIDSDSFDISDIDLSIGILLKDSEKAERFFTTIFASLAKEFGGRGDFGFFKIGGAMKNEYNGHKLLEI